MSWTRKWNPHQASLSFWWVVFQSHRIVSMCLLKSRVPTTSWEVWPTLITKKWEKTAPGADFDGPARPPGKTTFWPLFVLFFFCTEGKKCVLDHFFWDFGHSPLALQNSTFWHFFHKNRKVEPFLMRRICDAHDVFMVCVTHAVTFLRFWFWLF